MLSIIERFKNMSHGVSPKVIQYLNNLIDRLQDDLDSMKSTKPLPVTQIKKAKQHITTLRNLKYSIISKSNINQTALNSIIEEMQIFEKEPFA